MGTLRDSYQAAGEDESYYDASYDADWEAAYSVGPGWNTEEAVNTPAGQGSGGAEPDSVAEQKVNLGPIYHYENGQKVYDEGDYTPGPYYGESTPEAATGGSYSPSANYDWATPYTQVAAKSAAVTGLKSGLSTTQKAYGTVSTSQTVYPAGAEYPTFKGPTWSEGEIKKRTQKAAAPGLRSLEMKVNQAMSRYYENPNVRRMVLRDALAGYGIGISNIRAQASKTAQAEYGQEYSRMYSEAMSDFQRELGKLQTQATQVSSSKQVYTKDEYDRLTGGGDTLDTLD